MDAISKQNSRKGVGLKRDLQNQEDASEEQQDLDTLEIIEESEDTQNQEDTTELNDTETFEECQEEYYNARLRKGKGL